MNYVYSKDELEKIADEINLKFYPKRLNEISKLDPYDLLEKLGLDIEWKYISPNDSLLGIIFFENGEWYIWPTGDYKKGDIPRKEFFKKNTVVINQILLDNKEFKKEIFVCNHENAHAIKDVEYFSNSNSNILHICKEDSYKSTYWNGKMNFRDIIERQTNYLNAAILMPKDIIKKEFFKRLRYKNVPAKPLIYERYMTKVIKDLADDFGLNYNPVLYRLYDLNILERKK